MILSTYTENNLLNLIFGATAWAAKPGTLYYALLTAAPTDAGGGTEVSAAGYTRHAATVGSTYFEAATTNGAPVTNKLAVSFGTATAAWGTVVAWGLYDASAGGNLIAWGAIPPTIVGVNYTPSWAIGAFSFDVTGGFGDWLGKSILNYLFVGTTFPTIAKHYFALGTSASESGIVAEPAIGTYAYARKAMDNLIATWAAASSGTKSNAAAITFPASTGTAWGSMSHFAILSAGGVSRGVTASSSSGLLLTTAGTAFTTTHASELITSAAHGLTDGMVVVLSNSGGALPAGYSAATSYYVISATTDTFQLSTTLGGAAQAITDDGTGTHSWHHAHNLVVGDIIRFGTSAADLPAGLVENTNYYVQAIPVANTFRVAETAGGAAIAYTDAGTGTHTLYPQTIWHGALEAVVGSTVGDAPSFAAGALDIDLD